MSSVQAENPFLGRYELQKKIAVGGMAELYLAQVSGVGGFQKQVVVKRILPQLAESEELFRMFLDEARIAATLQHPNVVQVYDSCQENGEYFMAMEYLDGTDLRTLRKVLADHAMPLPWEHALHIVTSIAAGLHYAHDKRGIGGEPLGIVHRDVSPHNIFLTKEGGVKLVDFGIAKAEGRMTETAMGTLKGKLAYMSPEQCQGHHLDRRSDIYSLGIILYELTTGRRLYKGTTEYELIKEIVETDIKPPSSFMEYPEELEGIVLRCLEKNPEERYASARDVQADLEMFAREYQIMFSALGFSQFLEPLLEKAAAAAEKRWNHRKDVMPILTGNSGAVGVPMNRAARGSTPAPLPKPSAMPLPANLGSIPSILSQAPKAATPQTERSGSIVAAPVHAEEELTVPVPVDTLERIRAEERALIEEERSRADRDAVPRLARGTTGEHSISAHVVSRESSKIVIKPEDIFESIDIDVDEPRARATRDIERAISNTAILAKTHIAPKVERAASPPAEVFTDLDEQDLRVTRKSTGLWAAGLLALGLVGGGIAWSSQKTSDGSKLPAAAEETKPTVGTLAVDGAEGADIWLFLGRTPISTIAVNGVQEHRVRIEHEGYHSEEAILGSSTWKRDDSGTLYATGDFQLLSNREELPEGEPAETESFAQSRPANIRLTSTPSSASAWLFVGTTPNVSLGNLDLGKDIQLRIEQGAQPPTFQVLRAEDFDAAGKASITIEAPVQSSEPEPEVAESQAPAPAPVKKWRPRKKAPTPKGKTAPLSGPTPEWAK